VARRRGVLFGDVLMVLAKLESGVREAGGEFGQSGPDATLERQGSSYSAPCTKPQPYFRTWSLARFPLLCRQRHLMISTGSAVFVNCPILKGRTGHVFSFLQILKLNLVSLTFGVPAASEGHIDLPAGGVRSAPAAGRSV
jgi:hypothetical protein